MTVHNTFQSQFNTLMTPFQTGYADKTALLSTFLYLTKNKMNFELTFWATLAQCTTTATKAKRNPNVTVFLILMSEFNANAHPTKIGKPFQHLFIPGLAAQIPREPK